MFKYVVVFALAVACVNAAPGAVLAAQYVGAPVVTAHSSQVIARNYNGLAAPLVATAPYVAAPLAAPLVRAAPYIASPYVTAPVVKAAAPLVAAPALAHYASPALAHYSSPFAHYQAAPAYYL